MATDTEERAKSPKLPTPMHALAVLLELSIVVTFVAERSVLGLGLCAAYSWFSATLALFRND